MPIDEIKKADIASDKAKREELLDDDTKHGKKEGEEQNQEGMENEMWKLKPFDETETKCGSFLEESSFTVLFPSYKEQYLQATWDKVRGALDKYHINCKLDVIEGSITVYTTKKTRDPFMILKARDLCRLLSRSVPFEVARMILEDDSICDIIRIKGQVSSKASFIRRRARLFGKNGATLRAIELLSNSRIFVYGGSVSVISHNVKDLMWVRQTVLGCINGNIHPVVPIRIQLVRRELAKKGVKGDWSKFVPVYKKSHKRAGK